MKPEQPNERTIYLFADKRGPEPLLEWLSSFKDNRVRARIIQRINRLTLGNFGYHRKIRGAGGIWELRLNFGPGYRVYYAEDDNAVVILLCAGQKNSQRRDIRKAKEYWTEYLEVQNNE